MFVGSFNIASCIQEEFCDIDASSVRCPVQSCILFLKTHNNYMVIKLSLQMVLGWDVQIVYKSTQNNIGSWTGMQVHITVNQQ